MLWVNGHPKCLIHPISEALFMVEEPAHTDTQIYKQRWTTTWQLLQCFISMGEECQFVQNLALKRNTLHCDSL